MKTAGIALGLLLIGAGAAALIAINVQFVPLLVNRSSIPEPVRPLARGDSVPVRPALADAAPAATADAAIAEPGDASSPVTADSGAIDAAPADAPAADATGGAPTFQAITFEPKSPVPGNTAIDIVRPLAAYLKSHFEMRVLLEGHGDADASPHEYRAMGSARSRAVMRMLIENGISAGRIGIEQPKDNVDKQRVGGTVQIEVEPRFAEQKGKRNVP